MPPVEQLGMLEQTVWMRVITPGGYLRHRQVVPQRVISFCFFKLLNNSIPVMVLIEEIK